MSESTIGSTDRKRFDIFSTILPLVIVTARTQNSLRGGRETIFLPILLLTALLFFKFKDRTNYIAGKKPHKSPSTAILQEFSPTF